MSSDRPPDQEEHFRRQRQAMVDQQLRPRQITDWNVLQAFESVPRDRFVPDDMLAQAYDDRPLPIGYGQTISQPFVVAYMIELAKVKGGDRVLDIGGGSGYQAAILAHMQCEVVSVEIVPELALSERERLAALGIERVTVVTGDVLKVLDPHDMFDAIIAAAAPEHVPRSLLTHLAPGGRMVLPVGVHDQELLLIEKWLDGSIHEIPYGRVAFVPMTGDVSL